MPAGPLHISGVHRRRIRVPEGDVGRLGGKTLNNTFQKHNQPAWLFLQEEDLPTFLGFLNLAVVEEILIVYSRKIIKRCR